MIVSLIGKNIMYNLNLPKQITGNYWITEQKGEKGRKLVNIEGNNNEWQVVNNNYVEVINMKYIEADINNLKITDIGKVKSERAAILKENEMYYVYIRNTREVFIMFCSPSYDNTFLRYDIVKNEEICIGRSVKSQILYNNKMVANLHAKIYNVNGRMVLENYDECLGTFVNNMPVGKNGHILTNGDTIFIMGLKIIIMGKSLFINEPNNNVLCKKENLVANSELPTLRQETHTEETNFEDLYKEDEYFSRAPRITNIIETEKMKIDAPPHIQDKEEMPAILAIGSSLTMGVMMFASIFNAIDGKVNGTTSSKQMVVQLITAGAMLIAMILFPILTVRYNKNKKKRYEEKRQTKYKEYLENKSEQINKIMSDQRKILFENYPSPEECTDIILHKGAKLWERKIDDYDFLTVRLGIGDIPLKLDINYPEEQFTMDDDNLIEILDNIVKNSKLLKAAPISVSLVEKNVLALITKKNEKAEKFIQSLIIQLITFQSYEDLKLVFFLKEEKNENLEYVRMLPHVWDNAKQIRFFTYDMDEMNEVSKYLEEELQERLEQQERDIDYKSFSPYYLIITNDYKRVENLKIITEILKLKTNIGFSILCITDDMMQLPNECKTFISIDKNNQMGTLFENEITTANTQRHIALDNSATFFFEKICQVISNIPIRYTQSGTTALPSSYTFLEMYDVGKIEQLNIFERWNKNNPTLSLKAPIGIDSYGMPIVLDIHEKYHGPHGLIAGSTGSGKSEFIITYILSLAINYHPDDVAFILIDYKGGGLAGAFDNAKVKLPHLVGTITNIDTIGLQRSLVSIQSELRRRQVAFNEARNLTDEGTIDIYKYQKMYHAGIVKKPIPHLLIICDEFAELKQQQQEFMDELMSVSRIGRSLGVHLILATQKPAGIVNDQIRSNSKFAVCLKVQDKGDSTDVIKRPDAANLKRVGQFYLQVGNDEYFVLGQSAYAGAPYIPTDLTEKKVDNSVAVISNIGTIIKQVDDEQQKIINTKGEQLTSILKYMANIAKERKIKSENLWLPAIPENIYVSELRRKYNIETENRKIEPVIGEFDDPYNQRQGVKTIDINNGGNTVVYGNAESGKETLLSTMIYDLISTHTTDEINLYILDFGTEALKIYRDAPQVGDVVFVTETEKITRFFAMLQRIIKERKEKLTDYNGDYNLYLKTAKEPMPVVTVILNNYDSFAEIYQDKYEDIILALTRDGAKCGVVFVFSVTLYNSLRYRLTQNFKQKVALQMNDENDYYNVFEKVKKKRPSHLFGRGLIDEDGEVYEFQTAKICEAEEYTTKIKDQIEQIKKQKMPKAPAIPILPDKVRLQDVKKYLKSLSFVPIGITKNDLKVCGYDFKKNLVNIITSRDMDAIVQLAKNLLEELELIKNVQVCIFDIDNMISSEKENVGEKLIELMNNMQNEDKETMVVIIGIERFLAELTTAQIKFADMLNKMESNKRTNVIIVENVNKLKNHEYDEWYKTYVAKDNGIWIGNGIDTQYSLTINAERKEIEPNCGSSFGYAVKQGTVQLVKLLGMKEKGDEDE